MSEGLEKLYTIKQVAEYFNLTRQTLSKLEKNGILIPIHVGKNIRYKEADIKKIIDAKKEETK